jgi:SAM-dependent methyltransferase
MPVTAFGRAMMDSINSGEAKTFKMTAEGHPQQTCACSDFLQLRPEEQRFLAAIELPENGNVLDYGCGIGRHLSCIRANNPAVHCFGIDICDLLKEHCQQAIAAPTTIVSSFAELDGIKFDLIMLLGNGLGVLGSEVEARTKLQSLIEALNPGGKILIETGHPGTGYFCTNLTIEYCNYVDGPFVWGCSDKQWIKSVLNDAGCDVKFERSTAPGNWCFIAIGNKRG